MVTTTTTLVPKHGGVIFGVYQEGSALIADYKFSKKKSYGSTTQLRSSKALSQGEDYLHKSRYNMTVLKFDGKSETNSGKLSPH